MFSTNLKYLRKLHGLDQQSFAKKINRSVSTVSEWESGKYTPKAGILADIANMFNVKLDDMMSKDLSIIKEDIFDNTISVMKLLNPDRQQNVYNYADNQLKEQN
ncbi:helix-turn-helix transcriptional regulator, partial [Lactiplantibacillus pentosus]